MSPITIDGRDGGGQLIRTALSLSAVTATPFEVEHVRGRRPSPGLKAQHLAAIEAVGSLCSATVEGAEVGSEHFSFHPDRLAATDLSIDIGTAGSLTLLFDAVLPLSTALDAACECVATGGTDVAWAPPFDYFERVKLPLLRAHGLETEIDLERTGFYPTGGGRAQLGLSPSRLTPFELEDRGSLQGIEVYSKASADLSDASVADRQADRAVSRLEDRSMAVSAETVDYVETASTGSSLVIVARYSSTRAGFSALGERGKPSETVADEAVDRLLAFDDGPGAVDDHLADQLLVFLGLAGGRIRVPRLTDHVQSNASLIQRFGVALELTERQDGSVLVEA